MTIISGGVWCDGAFNLRMQADTPLNPATTTLNQYMRLVPDPLGRPYNVMRAVCFQSVAAALGTSGSLRAEAQSPTTAVVWGQTYVYHWRIVVPPDWINYGPSSTATIAQCHEVNAAAVARRPTLDCDIVDNVLKWNLSMTSIPAGVAIYSKNIAPGSEVEFTLRARWADGTNEPAANGVFELHDGGTLVYSLNGQKNTWDGTPVTEPNPPYIKAGIYQPNSGAAWWAGRQLSMCHVATIVADADETPASLRSFVDQRLAANGNSAKIVAMPSGQPV